MPSIEILKYKMKKILKISGVSFFLILLAAIVLPIIFKSEIREAVDNEIRKRVDADVYFGDFSVTLFRNFPNLTVGLEKFGIVNHAPFRGDTLVSVTRFNLVVDIMSVLFGERYELRKIVMDEPRIHATVLKNGKANWDIMKQEAEIAAADTMVVDSGRASFGIAINGYKINDGYLKYDDRESEIFLELNELNHSGKGDFSEKEFEFFTTTTATKATFSSGGTHYLKKGEIDLDVNLKVNQESGMYSLMKNRFRFNELELNLEGWLKMGANAYDMDLKYSTPQTSFRNLLSMVPGMYTAEFKDINSSGDFKLDGTVKGKYSEIEMPGFTLNLDLIGGYFQYPSLPQAVSNINGKIGVDASDGNYDNMKISIPNLHADFGNNPIDLKLVMSGMTSENLNIDANVNAKLNLEELNKIYPMEGQTLKGAFSLEGKATGTYNSQKGSFPKVDAKISLENGYVKSADFPSAIEKLNFNGTMTNQNGSLAETILDIPAFHAEIDGEPVDARFNVRNFDNPNYQVSFKGNLDLGKLAKIYPIEGTSMAGKMIADIQTSGVYSDVEAGNYMNLPTSGSLILNGFSYMSTDVPQGITIDNGKFTFTPLRLNIDAFNGKIGRSPVSITGFFENYIAYFLMENQDIRGSMNLVSSFFDVNEWLADDASGAEAQAASTTAPADQEMYVFEVPKGVDFTIAASITKVFYDNLIFENLNGRVTVRNQEIRFEGLTFGTLGGRFGLAGSYNTKDLSKPFYDLNFNLAGMQVKPVWENFNTVQALAPAAKFVNGIFNSVFNLKGTLTPDMIPDLTTITGAGDMQLINANVSNFNVLNEIAEKTKLASLKELKLNDTKIFFEVKNGRLNVKPFDVKVAGTNMKVQGSNGFDKSLDYILNFDIPAGLAGATATSALSGLSGKTISGTDKINVDLNLGGTIDHPRITGAGSGAIDNLKDQAKQAVDQKVDEVKEEVKEKIDETKEQIQDKAQEQIDKAKEEAERLKREAEAKARAEADRVKQEIERKKQEEEARIKREADAAKKKAEEEAKKKLKNLIKP